MTKRKNLLIFDKMPVYAKEGRTEEIMEYEATRCQYTPRRAEWRRSWDMK